MHALSDLILLQRWRDERDATAFQALAQRYSGIVFGVCHRILKNSADAEEVAQDCFLKLATHPAAAKRSVGPWLHSVAVRASLDRIRGEKRRREREHAYAGVCAAEPVDSANALLADVDEAIAHLPESLRACVVRHFLEQMTQEEVAAAMGISVRTVRRRTQDAIEQIRGFLRQRGVQVSAGALTAALAGLGAGAAPASLQITLGKLAIGSEMHSSAATTTAAAGTAISQVGGLLVMKKLAGIVGLLAVAALVSWQFTGGGKEAPAANPAPATPADDGSTPPPAPPTPATPAPGTATEESPQVESGKESENVLWSRVEDVSAFAPQAIDNPTKYASIAGVVVDEQGDAIPGAAVRAIFQGGENVPMQHPGDVTRLAYSDLHKKLWEDGTFRRETVTDGSGAFHIGAIPFTGSAQLWISAPGYAPRAAAKRIEPETVTEVSCVLKAARAVHGELVTPAGRPVVGALVDAEGQVGEFASNVGGPTPEAWRNQTDERGHFSLWLPELRAGGEPITGELFTAVHVKSNENGEALFFPVPVGGEERVKLTLEPELGTLAGQIHQSEGVPAVGYHVFLKGNADFRLGGQTSLVVGQGHGYEAVTDARGNYEIDGVATFLKYTATLYAPDRELSATRGLPEIIPGETTIWNHTIDAPIHVEGVVYGEGTRTPISGAEVFWMPATPGPDGRTSGTSTRTDERGAFSVTITTGEGPYRFIPVLETFLIARKGEDGPVYEKTVELQAGEEILIELEVPNPWKRPFQIVDPAGNPLGGVRATMHRQMGESIITSRRLEQSDEAGFVEFSPLSPELPVSFRFEKAGYLPAQSGDALGAAGETLPVETIVLYPHADLSARLLDASGAPIVNTNVNCEAYYAEGRSTLARAATNAEGWVWIQGELPGTNVELHFSVEPAEGAGALEARLENTALSPDSENDIGEIVMAPAL